MPLKIKFHTQSEFLAQPELHPVPAKKLIPNWYKNLRPYFNDEDLFTQLDSPTVKKCIPFLDSISSGYIIKAHTDLYVRWHREKGVTIQTKKNIPANIPVNKGKEYHHPAQLGKECPFNHKSDFAHIVKILNIWQIVTPPGYSCLITKPLNSTEDRFTPFTGIVDTDTYREFINFPTRIEKEGEFVIEKETPIVQVLPFKRDEWKMQVGQIDKMEYKTNLFRLTSVFEKAYRKLWWTKKIFN